VLAAPPPGGAAADDRPFRGHLTLARARGRAAVPSSLVGVALGGGWTAGRVSLVRSQTHPAGARYDEVAGRALDEGA
jgi:2'-5' RNA ligase